MGADVEQHPPENSKVDIWKLQVDAALLMGLKVQEAIRKQSVQRELHGLNRWTNPETLYVDENGKA